MPSSFTNLLGHLGHDLHALIMLRTVDEEVSQSPEYDAKERNKEDGLLANEDRARCDDPSNHRHIQDTLVIADIYTLLVSIGKELHFPVDLDGESVKLAEDPSKGTPHENWMSRRHKQPSSHGKWTNKGNNRDTDDRH